MKYNNQPTVVDNYKFDSKIEARVYMQLKLLQNSKIIKDLILHPKYELRGERGNVVCKCLLDFSFIDSKNMERFIDVKGKDNSLSRLKRKWLESDYNIKVELWRKLSDVSF